MNEELEFIVTQEKEKTRKIVDSWFNEEDTLEYKAVVPEARAARVGLGAKHLSHKEAAQIHKLSTIVSKKKNLPSRKVESSEEEDDESSKVKQISKKFKK